MTPNDDLNYQDPILTPGNLRKVVQNLPGKIKDQHENYDYNCDSDTFEAEINEFFTYTEVTIQLQEYRRLYEKEFIVSDWMNNTNDSSYRSQHITLLMDIFKHKEQKSRLKACKNLVYISLGHFTTAQNESKQKRIDTLIDNNNVLLECGAFDIFYQKLQQSCAEYSNIVSSISSLQKNTIGICAEIDLYLTLMYVLLETQRYQYPSKSSERFKDELVMSEPNLAEFLLSLLAKLREKLDKSFPVKKTVLLLWKSLLFMSGGQEEIKASSNKAKQALGLSTVNKKIIAKSTPQDFLTFQNEITDKYSGYVPPDFPFSVSSPLTINASPALAKAMGYSNATDQVTLLYQTLFPPKSSSASTNGTSSILNGLKKQNSNNQLQNNYFMYPSNHYVTPAFILPLTHTGSDVPESIKEAGDVYISNMHLSLMNYQLIQERSKAIQKWHQQREEVSMKNVGSPNDDKKQYQKQQDQNADLIEMIYAKIVPDLQNIIAVLLKLVLSAVSITPSSSSGGNSNNSDSANDNDDTKSADRITLDQLEEVDIIRNREVYSKAISGILMILLKWTKSSHVLKFEYISQLLADSGYLLLILKIIGLQEIANLVKAQTDMSYCSFFNYNVNRQESAATVAEEGEKTDQSITTYTNRRNMYWAINYLRILQMLTKHKTHRVMLLVQYKSAAILKRLLKISHPVFELYILKLLKSQVPYLGRKWRSKNMKIISAIYLNCHTTLRDDWISKVNAEGDLDEGKMQENNIRILTGIYNGERYLPSLLPLHDEINTANGCIPIGPGLHGFIRYDMDILRDNDLEDFDLDPQFIDNYEKWLEAEVYSVADDDDTEEEDGSLTRRENNNLHMDTPAPSTPYPTNENDSNNTISHEKLSYEINKLYIEQVNAEFRPLPPITIASPSTSLLKKKEEEEWESPPVPKKLTPLARYNGDENNLTYISGNRRRMLGGGSSFDLLESQSQQIQEELMSKLIQVEEKTIQKWYSSRKLEGGDNVGRYYFKILDDLYDNTEGGELYYNIDATTDSNRSTSSNGDFFSSGEDEYASDGGHFIRKDEEEVYDIE